MKKIKELVYEEVKQIIKPEISKLIEKLSQEGKNETVIKEEINMLIGKKRKETPIEKINIGELFDYLFEMKEEEFLARGESEIRSREDAEESSKKIIRRVTRGMYPYYFLKDKAYFEGRIVASELKKAEVDRYAVQSKIDPNLAKDFIELGIDIDIESREVLEKAKETVKRMWGKIVGRLNT